MKFKFKLKDSVPYTELQRWPAGVLFITFPFNNHSVLSQRFKCFQCMHNLLIQVPVGLWCTFVMNQIYMLQLNLRCTTMSATRLVVALRFCKEQTVDESFLKIAAGDVEEYTDLLKQLNQTNVSSAENNEAIKV